MAVLTPRERSIGSKTRGELDSGRRGGGRQRDYGENTRELN